MLILNLEPDRFSKKAESILRKVSDYIVVEKNDDNQSIQNTGARKDGTLWFGRGPGLQTDQKRK